MTKTTIVESVPKAQEPAAETVKPMMPPTIGRKVWYWPSDSDTGLEDSAPMGVIDPAQALDATVTCVLETEDGEPAQVNLWVVDHENTPHGRSEIELFQDVEEALAADYTDGGFATWMPYQVGQARKASGDAK